MTITITINTDNAAFEDNPRELSDIFRTLAGKAHSAKPEDLDGLMLRDSNGNTVGVVTVEGE